MNWSVEQLDINNAFLNGDLQETVYMAQPEGFIQSDQPTFVCKLNKSLYGLKQAARAWLYFCSKSTWFQELFHGFEVVRTASGLHVSQTKYATDLLKKTNMLHFKACATTMVYGVNLTQESGENFSDASLYRSTIGALQYLTISRPDIAFAVNKLSQYLSAPTTSHWLACKRILRYIKGTINCGLFFQHSPQLQLTAFTDAGGSCLDDRKSTSGLCVFLGKNLIIWGARKQKVLARSSTEAEYRALAQAATEVIWLQSLFAEPKLSFCGIPIIWCDNTCATSLTHNPGYHV